jgi:hypothetical protein
MRAHIGSVQEDQRQTESRGAVLTVWRCTLWSLVTLVCSLLATLYTAEAQPRAKVPRIGFLGSSSPSSDGRKGSWSGFLRLLPPWLIWRWT